MVLLLGIAAVTSVLYIINRSSSEVKTANIPSEVKRQAELVNFSSNNVPSISANKLPEFEFDISDQKFSDILNASQEDLKSLVKTKIAHSAYAEEKLSASVSVDKNKKKLIIQPEDVANFKPGLYKLSVTLRTLEGNVDVNQDFSWGVIAVNTNKSIYKPGEIAKIGVGVLNNDGETLCLTGLNHVKQVDISIKDPAGQVTNLSTKDNTIKDSGKCGPTTVTMDADFKTEYQTNQPGIYQMTIRANIKGEEKQITDYFKVDPNVKFDVERTSFPTRIYPRSVYAPSFTVTAKEDYSGTIEDLVPGFFTIEHISDGGKTEKDGDFTRITWNVKLKAGESKSFSYFVHFPLVSPEFYLLGPIKIGDFQEARQWQIASDAINSTSGLVTLEDNGSSNTWSRIWTGTTWSPALGSTPTSMSTTPGDSRWFREVSSPKTGEKIVALIDNKGSNDVIDVFTWNGSSWGGGTPSWTVTLSSTTADVTRPFDVAYEEVSGDALVVYSDYSTNQLHYRKRVAGVWDGSSSNAGTGFDVYKRWVRLQPQFNSDSILVGYLNNNERVGAMIWDGSTDSFINQFSDASGTATSTSNDQAFDIAWETLSGTPMIFWGTTANNLVQREFTSGSWQAESSVATGFTNDADWVFAASDPVATSDNISLAVQDLTTCRARFGVWTGSSATFNGTVPTCASATTNNLVATAFENNSGKAMFVYVSSSSTSQISWLTWTSGGGFTSSTTEAGTTTNIEGMQLYSDLNTTSMMLLYHDNSGASSVCQLWDREWDGTSWSAKNANPVFNNMCASADNDTEPYGFGFDRNLEQQVAYRWFDNNNGTSVTTALTTQDTPYTLTSANQIFRLRLLIYTTDTLTTSLRNYKLQFVDPGSGTCADPSGGTPSTWTDVATSGTEISYYNNPSPADGATLTANGSLDPTYQGLTVHSETYEEANNFTNSVSSIPADELGEWDFSLIDNTTFDRVGQTFCFRVARSSDVVLQIGIYPQISTAALNDVTVQGGTYIRPGTTLQ